MYDLYLFDLDGTLINTEYCHYLAYKKTIEENNIDCFFDYAIYCKYAHYDDNSMKLFIESKNNMVYEKFYQMKKNNYLNILSENLNLINGIEELINKLHKANIKMCIVTHSDRETIEYILNKLPVLKLINKIITRDDYINKKPHPEPYIKALTLFPECKNPIGFEDSYKGYLSMDKTNITSCFIGDENYYYYDKIKPINRIKDFIDFNENLIMKKNNDILINDITYKLKIYDEELLKIKNSTIDIINKIYPLITNTTNNIYLTGIGKCGHICKKSVSTWQSMGISCHYLNLPDLSHGDYGILKENDIIIYISNSGNTIELLNCAEYIKNKFKVLQIALTLNNSSEVSNVLDFTYVISNKIREIDKINMAPTTSSVIFMIFLDLLGVYIAEKNNITIDKFKLCHPGGDLGKKSSNIIDNVVIVASGMGSRLYPLTKYIPKILVNYNNKPFIKSLIDYWSQYCKNIIIIINSQYESIVKFYTDKYTDLNIKFKIFNEYTGTADTINKTITNEYYNKNILFTWCDIIPNEQLLFNNQNTNNNIIFTYSNECRYMAKNNKIYKNQNGNVIGLYYINNYLGIKLYNIGDDICDVFIKNFNSFTEYNLDKLIDIGDMEKLTKNIINNQFQTRFFNNIIINNDNQIIKKSNCDQGDNIIKKEINWYNHINNTFLFIPKYQNISSNSFKLELLDAVPLYKIFKHFNLDKKQLILNKIYNNLSLLHNDKIIVDNMDKIKNDIYQECYIKIIDRLDKVKILIDYFGKINKVNGLNICDIDLHTMLNKLKDILLNNLDNEYNLIHGDCQFSNILYNESYDNIYFIDPRGYFGNTELYGKKEYDYAKILYALSGYDDLNNEELFSIDIFNNEIIFNTNNYLNDIKYESNDKIKAWLIIIWLGLTQYNENNILKCIASYYYSIYLYKKLFLNSN